MTAHRRYGILRRSRVAHLGAAGRGERRAVITARLGVRRRGFGRTKDAVEGPFLSGCRRAARARARLSEAEVASHPPWHEGVHRFANASMVGKPMRV